MLLVQDQAQTVESSGAPAAQRPGAESPAAANGAYASSDGA